MPTAFSSQAFELGRWLAQRYRHSDGLLTGGYNSVDVWSRTTNYRRTRGTLHGVLSGLFPEENVGFHATTGQHEDDILLPQVNRCPHLASLMLCTRNTFKKHVRINWITVESPADTCLAAALTRLERWISRGFNNANLKSDRLCHVGCGELSEPQTSDRGSPHIH
jgi:hypothetical protein